MKMPDDYLPYHSAGFHSLYDSYNKGKEDMDLYKIQEKDDGFAIFYEGAVIEKTFEKRKHYVEYLLKTFQERPPWF